MAKLKLVALALCVLMFMSVVAAGTLLFTPDWRGQDGTTYQEWRFDDDDNPAVPEVIDNSYGGAEATITVGSASTGWLESGFGSLTGYWDIDSEGGSIILDISNQPSDEEYKEIWVQVICFASFTPKYQPPIVDVVGAEYLEGETELVKEFSGSTGVWFLNLSKWQIEPSPTEERIILTSHPTYGSLIDQIVVDTICIPEPAMIALLGLGTLSLLRRKYRA